MIDRVVTISRSHREAAEKDRRQHFQMTPAERQKAAAVLKKKIYGISCPDVRASHRQEK